MTYLQLNFNDEFNVIIIIIITQSTCAFGR